MVATLKKMLSDSNANESGGAIAYVETIIDNEVDLITSDINVFVST